MFACMQLSLLQWHCFTRLASKARVTEFWAKFAEFCKVGDFVSAFSPRSTLVARTLTYLIGFEAILSETAFGLSLHNASFALVGARVSQQPNQKPKVRTIRSFSQGIPRENSRPDSDLILTRKGGFQVRIGSRSGPNRVQIIRSGGKRGGVGLAKMAL